MANIEFSNADEVIERFGQPLLAQRKTMVRIRPAVGTEVFPRHYGNLTAVEGEDWILIPVDGAEPYPCKINIFADTWEPIEEGSELYRRKALSRLIPIPEGVTVILKTLEGETQVSHPDYIALGAHGEVYSNSKEWAGANLTFLNHKGNQ